MKLRHTLSVALGLAFTLACSTATAQVTEGVAAVVNDKVISTFDVRQRMRLMVLSTQVQPTEESMRRFQTQAIRALVDENLKVQEASKFEIVVSQAEIDQQITRLARQNDISADSVREDLVKADISPHTLEDQMRADIAWQILVSGRYGSRIRVSNNQIALEQQRFKDNLAKPQYLVSEILLESPSIEQDPAIYAGGMSLIQQMKEGAPFVAVAQQFSAAPSAQQGGDMGWIREGDMPREVNAVLNVMQVGTISNPIKVSGGFYIVAVRDRKDGSVPMMANFRQIVAPVDDMDKMTDFLNDVTSCEGADNITDVIEGSFVNPFADVAIGDLAPAFREILESLQPNQWSQPVESPNGAVSILLCSKGFAEGAGVPTENEIVDRITDQKLGMLARRYLRDLRRDSTIEIRTP